MIEAHFLELTGSHPDGYGNVIYLDDDQPTCCGQCGVRTSWVDGTFNGESVRLHTCLGCGQKFMSQDDPDFDADQDKCRTEDCDGDPNDGEGWDGYCGNCADERDPGDDEDEGEEDEPPKCVRTGQHRDTGRGVCCDCGIAIPGSKYA